MAVKVSITKSAMMTVPDGKQAAIVFPLHRAVFWIHAVLKSYHCPSPMLIKSLNMRECGGLLFNP